MSEVMEKECQSAETASAPETAPAPAKVGKWKSGKVGKWKSGKVEG